MIPADLGSAARVVSIDCDLTKLDARGVKIEEWTDIPKISDLPGSVAAIQKHVAELVERLKAVP